MNKIKIYILIFIFTLSLADNVMAVDGPASIYKIVIRKIELCDNTSTIASCKNPVILFSGTSDAMDIAATEAGAAAGSLGSLANAKFGTSYTHLQITMNRAMDISGSAVDGAGTTCYTVNGSVGTHSLNSDGTTSSGSQAETTLFAATVATNHTTALNSLTTLTDTETAGTVIAGDTLFQYRKALTTNFTMTTGIIPTVSIAFGTATAVGAAGNMTSDCDGTVSATLGMYGAEPDITVTIK